MPAKQSQHSSMSKRALAAAAQRAMLSCYFPVGDPLISLDLLEVYADSGVDVVELGLPSPHPRLDGPIVTASMHRALKVGDTRRGLDLILNHLARRSEAPRSLIMGYGDGFARDLPESCDWPPIDAVLVVEDPDHPVRCAIETRARLAGARVSAFVPASFDANDIAAACRADSYVMVQAATGVTGPRDAVDPAGSKRVTDLRAAGVMRPILLGFGISDGRQAGEALRLGADGVVVGSLCLKAALAGRQELAAVLADLRRGLDDHG
jgi:tryptophan synthase alpha subunit